MVQHHKSGNNALVAIISSINLSPTDCDLLYVSLQLQGEIRWYCARSSTFQCQKPFARTLSSRKAEGKARNEQLVYLNHDDFDALRAHEPFALVIPYIYVRLNNYTYIRYNKRAILSLTMHQREIN